MATEKNIRDVCTAYSGLIGITFRGIYENSVNLGPSDGSGSVRRLVISIEDNIDRMVKTFETIQSLYEGRIWKGFVWKRGRYKLFIGESDINSDVELTEGVSYEFMIIDVKEFGLGLRWNKPLDYIWKHGMNISLECQ